MLILIGDEIALGLPQALAFCLLREGWGLDSDPSLPDTCSRIEIWPFLLGSLVSVCGLAYVAIGWLEWAPWIAAIVVFGHAASAINWVLSTVLLQERSDDEWRGRLFSTDFLLMTTVNGCSTLVASLMLEYTDITLREGIQLFAILQVISRSGLGDADDAE